MTADFSRNVSRETLSKLEQFSELLQKWNPKINLISSATVDEIWSRHILDSAQICDVAVPNGLWLDIGSGGGLPGLVIAIIASEVDPACEVKLVESDVRKCAFLRSVVRELGLNTEVHNVRIEEMEPVHAYAMTARALTSLTNLLELASIHLKKDGFAIFPKGKSWQTEVFGAQQEWHFDLTPHPSKTDSEAALLEIRNIRRV